MDGDWLIQTFCLLRQTDLLQNLPDSLYLQIFIPGKILLTGGAPGDHPGIAKGLQLPVQKRNGIRIHLIPPGPVADGAAAAQHQGNAALQTLAQIQIRR